MNDETFQLTSVPITGGAAIGVGRATALFTVPAVTAMAGVDVSADGKTLFINRPVTEPGSAAPAAPRFTIVQNWFTEFAGGHR